MKRTDPIVSYYTYTDESRSRRCIVLGSRNRILQKSSIIPFSDLTSLISYAQIFGYLEETPRAYILTDHGLKYQEIFSHIFV
jgi:hypothetical protein